MVLIPAGDILLADKGKSYDQSWPLLFEGALNLSSARALYTKEVCLKNGY
jgi:hypothetical protein